MKHQFSKSLQTNFLLLLSQISISNCHSEYEEGEQGGNETTSQEHHQYNGP